MKVLVTGSEGFIGKNLALWLKNAGHEVLGYDLVDECKGADYLKQLISESDYIIHLAGVNRPLTPEEFIDGNVNFTARLLSLINESGSKSPILFSSSMKAEEDTPYGRSKLEAEKLLRKFGKENGNNIIIFRLYNVFGKWCRPNYNSVIATFCYNVAHDLPLEINRNAPAIQFIYIDDICRTFVKIIEENPANLEGIQLIDPRYERKLEDIASLLYSFKESRNNLLIPDMEYGFEKKLYSTYITYLDENDFAYPLNSHIDERGSFTEILKTEDRGQFSVNVTKPGITKGNHYHNTKNEKYLVVSGVAEIKFRKVGTHNIFTYQCDGKDLKVVDIPPGYTHSIKNIGDDDLITFMWANELYDPAQPDTYYLPVEEDK